MPTKQAFDSRMMTVGDAHPTLSIRRYKTIHKLNASDNAKIKPPTASNQTHIEMPLRRGGGVVKLFSCNPLAGSNADSDGGLLLEESPEAVISSNGWATSRGFLFLRRESDAPPPSTWLAPPFRTTLEWPKFDAVSVGEITCRERVGTSGGRPAPAPIKRPDDNPPLLSSDLTICPWSSNHCRSVWATSVADG